MKNSHQTINWGIYRRMGILLIIIALTSTVFYGSFPPKSITDIIQPSQIDSNRKLIPEYILVDQRNQILEIKAFCNNCNESVKLNIIILQMVGNNIKSNKTVKQITFFFKELNGSSFSLNPNYYLFMITLIGNFSVSLTISGYMIPNSFIFTQFFVVFIGIVFIILDRKKTKKSSIKFI